MTKFVAEGILRWSDIIYYYVDDPDSDFENLSDLPPELEGKRVRLTVEILD